MATGIAVADLDHTLLADVRRRMPVAQVGPEQKQREGEMEGKRGPFSGRGGSPHLRCILFP